MDFNSRQDHNLGHSSNLKYYKETDLTFSKGNSPRIKESGKDIQGVLGFCYVLHCYILINLKFEIKFKL